MQSLPVWIAVSFVAFVILLLAAIYFEIMATKKVIMFVPPKRSIPYPIVSVPFEPTKEFIEWWTPSELEHYAEIEKMTTPTGRHLDKTIEKISISSIPEHDPINQEGVGANDQTYRN